MDLFGKTLFFYHRVRYWFRDLARGAGWGSSSLQHISTNWLANERPRIKFPEKGGKACENTSAGAGKAARESCSSQDLENSRWLHTLSQSMFRVCI